MNSFSRWIKDYYQKYPVSATLLFINTIMVVITLLMGGFTIENLIKLGGMNPLLVSDGHEYYRLFMAMFLHGSLIHFLANSYFLYMIGRIAEKLLGKVKYIIIYLISGIGSSLLVWALGQNNRITIGASGALFGILGALLVLTYLKPHWFTAYGIRNIRTLVIINLAFTFIISYISVYGHIGGFVTGMILIYFLMPNRKPLKEIFKHKKKDDPEVVIIDHDDISDDDIYYS